MEPRVEEQTEVLSEAGHGRWGLLVPDGGRKQETVWKDQGELAMGCPLWKQGVGRKRIIYKPFI